MRKILIISLALLFASCNPFISDQLRQKNKCNRKIERELKRHKRKAAKINIICPGAIVNDTIRDTLIVEIPKVEIRDSIILVRDTVEIDSLVNLIKNKKTRKIIRDFIIKYIPIKDTIITLTDGYMIRVWSSDGNIHYTVDKPAEVIKKVSETIVEELKPIELTLLEKITNGLLQFWWIAVLFLLLILVIRYIRKRFF